jgi:hypothetical protein
LKKGRSETAEACSSFSSWLLSWRERDVDNITNSEEENKQGKEGLRELLPKEKKIMTKKGKTEGASNTGKTGKISLQQTFN